MQWGGGVKEEKQLPVDSHNKEPNSSSHILDEKMRNQEQFSKTHGTFFSCFS